jgi:hypothetical protein
MYRILLIICFSIVFVQAQTTLSGNIGGLTLDSTGNPFWVKENISIDEGKTLTINAGCILLFENFKGLSVKGNLAIIGTRDKPVVFTSNYDDRYNLNSIQEGKAFDWNGIVIEKDGKITATNFLIANSVFGLKSESGDVKLSNGIFYQNGQYNFSIKGRINRVADNFPFNYGVKTEIDDKSIERREHFKSMLDHALPYTIGSIGILSLCGAVYSFSEKDEYHSKYLNEQDVNRMRSLQNQEKTSNNYGIGFSITSVIAIPASTLLFIKQAKKHKISKLTIIYNPDQTCINFSLAF